MNDAEFQLLERMEDEHWWFVGKRCLLRALLSRHGASPRMLDLGCGTGGILLDWAGVARSVGVDGSRLALEICARKGFKNLVRADLARLPFRPGAFRTVLLLDVIEHLDDDVGFLEHASTLCEPGGRVIVSVPAYQGLWSQHDQTFQHRRRYTAGSLVRAVRAAGLVPERTTYTNCLVFPVAAVWRVLSYRLGLGRFAPPTDFWTLPKPLNSLLIQVYRLEAWLLSRFDLPVGVSVVCSARRADCDGLSDIAGRTTA